MELEYSSWFEFALNFRISQIVQLLHTCCQSVAFPLKSPSLAEDDNDNGENVTSLKISCCVLNKSRHYYFCSTSLYSFFFLIRSTGKAEGDV